MLLLVRISLLLKMVLESGVACVKLPGLVVGCLNVELLPVPFVHDVFGKSLTLDVPRTCLAISIYLKRVF